MKYPKYAIVALVWATGMAGAQPSGPFVDSVVLPVSAIAPLKAAPVPLSASVRTHFVVLPALEEGQTLSSGDASGPALQIGTARAVSDTSTVAQTQSALHWTTLPTGQKVAAINIHSTGAYGLRAGVLVERLPDGALLRVYSLEHPDAIIERSGADINALLALNREAGETGAAANTWWTPDVGAGDATVEVVLPSGTSGDALHISIPMISHIYQNLSLPTEEEWEHIVKANALSCHLDVSCTDDYKAERNAVARMSYSRANGKSYLCTGTLLNNSKEDLIPYFLTANHCISTQSEASTLQTRWLYSSESCNSGVPGASNAWRYGGSSLLYASATSDSTLLKLNDTPPEGVTFAGWYASDVVQTSTPVYGLHHPRGDLLKYSVGQVSDYAGCRSNGDGTFSCQYGEPDGNFYSVNWSEGTLEGGSSGSALFQDGRVVATLYGGSHSCSALQGNTLHGRFDKFFVEGASRWLDPSTDAAAPDRQAGINFR